MIFTSTLELLDLLEKGLLLMELALTNMAHLLEISKAADSLQRNLPKGYEIFLDTSFKNICIFKDPLDNEFKISDEASQKWLKDYLVFPNDFFADHLTDEEVTQRIREDEAAFQIFMEDKEFHHFLKMDSQGGMGIDRVFLLCNPGLEFEYADVVSFYDLNAAGEPKFSIPSETRPDWLSKIVD